MMAILDYQDCPVCQEIVDLMEYQDCRVMLEIQGCLAFLA